MDYKLKYLKYKSKYLNLLQTKSNIQHGSSIPNFESIQYLILNQFNI